jgi:hypothetical protein
MTKSWFDPRFIEGGFAMRCVSLLLSLTLLASARTSRAEATYTLLDSPAAVRDFVAVSLIVSEPPADPSAGWTAARIPGPFVGTVVIHVAGFPTALPPFDLTNPDFDGFGSVSGAALDFGSLSGALTRPNTQSTEVTLSFSPLAGADQVSFVTPGLSRHYTGDFTLTSAHPEPTSAILLTLGIAGIFALRSATHRRPER